MRGGEGSIAGGEAREVIASTAAGAWQETEVSGSVGAGGEGDVGKLTKSTETRGGGGAATDLKAGSATALAEAEDDKGARTKSSLVGATTWSVGGRGGGADMGSVAVGAGTGSMRGGGGGGDDEESRSKASGTDCRKGDGVKFGATDDAEVGACCFGLEGAAGSFIRLMTFSESCEW